MTSCAMHALRINADDAISISISLYKYKTPLMQSVSCSVHCSPNPTLASDGEPMPMTPTRYSMSAAAVVVVVVVISVVAGLASAGTSDLCGLAKTAFSDCTAYVAGAEPSVSRRCCRGLGDIRELAATAAQRRAVCACILAEMLAAGAGKVNSGRAAGLPAACNVRVGFVPTSPKFNCFRIR